MWISRQMTGRASENQTQTGRITLNLDGEIEAVSNGVDRNIKTFHPYGYAGLAPAGEEILLTQSCGEQVALGVKAGSGGLECGEIKITSLAGGYIYLKSDGSVIINGLEITKEGVINDKR